MDEITNKFTISSPKEAKKNISKKSGKVCSFEVTNNKQQILSTSQNLPNYSLAWP
jgi:hypothetical protein